ncbi:MAG: guanylate kinase [Clostridiales bacterium]|nr:guanylate kinase [Clostridiales bacterium]
MYMNNIIVVLSGPSGAGKGTIYKEIAKEGNTYRYVSCTTRSPREGEVEGFDYEYISKQEFKEREDKGFFLETSLYDSNYYGTPIPDLDKHYPNDIFFDVNVEGGINIKKAFPNAILIYIIPPTIEELIKRMGDRGKGRIEIAKKEVEVAKKVYDYLVVNDNLQEAIKQVKKILEVERINKMKNSSNQDFLKNYY